MVELWENEIDLYSRIVRILKIEIDFIKRLLKQFIRLPFLASF